ncbi:MAG TPA: hypothetical protein VFF27_11625 [Bacteroidia bacterium]|nr:hypothetical protein [Bacteroidia bacterium]
MIVVYGMSTSSCKKKVDEQPNSPESDSVITPYSFYFQGIFDGQPISYQVGVDTYEYGFGHSNTSHTPLNPIITETASIYSWSRIPAAGIGIRKKFKIAPTPAQRDSMFLVQSYPYYNTPDSTEGAVVFIQDSRGVEWSTDLGSGDQTGSTFQIVEQIKDIVPQTRAITKAVFSCKLYDGKGHSKMLMSGSFRGRCIFDY